MHLPRSPLVVPKTFGRIAWTAQLLALTVLGLLMTGMIIAVPVEAASVKPSHRAADLLPVVNQKDILPRQRTIADEVLRALPPSCRRNLRNFYVTYDKSPRNRGLGGESTIIVTGTVRDSEFRALIVHECGHITDLGGLRGYDLSRPSMFIDGTTPITGDDPSVLFYQISWLTPTVMQPGTMAADFVSGYAETDPFEDFAETYAYYVLQQREFAKIAAKNPILQAKYDFMSRIVFAGEQKVADGRHTRGRSIPWDVTRLPYVWHAKR